MVARKRREDETFKKYRENLKHEEKMDRYGRPRKYLAKHKVSYSAKDGYTINPTQYKAQSLSS